MFEQFRYFSLLVLSLHALNEGDTLVTFGLKQRLALELLEGQNNALLQSRLATAFHVLLNANQVTSSLDRQNRRKFRENLYSFLSDVRGFLRTR